MVTLVSLLASWLGLVALSTRVAPLPVGDGPCECWRAVSDAAYERAVDDLRSRRRGGRSGRPAAVLPCLRRGACAVGVCAPARGADARWRSFAAPAEGVLPGVRDHACAAAGLVCAAPARQRGGDRPGAVGQGARGWAPHDRGAAGAAARHRARLAARLQPQGGGAVELRAALDARDGRGRLPPARTWRLTVQRRRGRARQCRQSMQAVPGRARRAMGAGGRDHRTATRAPARPTRVLAAAPLPSTTADPRTLLTGLGQRIAPDGGGLSPSEARERERATLTAPPPAPRSSKSREAAARDDADFDHPAVGRKVAALSSQIRTSPRTFGRSVVRPSDPLVVWSFVALHHHLE